MQQNYRPQQHYAPRANNYREFRPQFNAPRPYHYNEQPQTRNYWTEPSDSPHLFTQLMLIDQFIGSQQKIPLKTFLDRE